MNVRKLSLMTVTIASVMFFGSCESDPCKDVTCANGTPTELLGSCYCDCDTGYEGDNCDVEERAKFIGTYNVSGTISCPVSGNGTIPSGTVMTISNSSTGVTKVIVNLAGTLTLVCTIDGNSITIDNQTVSGFTYTGSGALNSNNITLTINEDEPGVEVCVYSMSGTKQ